MCAALQPEDFFQAARVRAQTLSLPRAQEAREQLRPQGFARFARIPEPPGYHRRGDPGRQQAEALLPDVEKVLALGLAVEREAGSWDAGEKLLAALKGHGEALCHTVDGRLGPAGGAGGRAMGLEPLALPLRAFGAKARGAEPVFDRQTGASRYDPREE